MQRSYFVFRVTHLIRSTEVFFRNHLFAIGVVLLLCNVVTQASASPEKVRLLSQYDYAPFQTGPEEGLTFALAKYLTENSNGAYLFIAEVLPRKRLDIYMADSTPLWVVPWAVPRFFGGDSLSKYEWTKPFMQDGNYLLTQHKSGIRYSGPESLAGLRLGGTLGHRYGPLEPLIQEGRLTREDCVNLVCNLEKLKRDRVDVVWFPSGALSYFRQMVPDFDALIDVSPQPVETFERSFILPKGNAELLRYMNTVTMKLSADPKWKADLSPATSALKKSK